MIGADGGAQETEGGHRHGDAGERAERAPEAAPGRAPDQSGAGHDASTSMPRLGLPWGVARIAPRGGQSGDLRLRPLAPDVYIYRGFFSNSAVLVLPDAVVVVDTQTSPHGARR